jgi:hypothetical protein
MSDPNSTGNTTTTTTTATSISTKVEISLEPEAEKLFKAQENIPATCEESLQVDQISWSRSKSALSVIKTAAVLSLIVIVAVTTIAAVISGDTSKLATAATALNNIVQTLALQSNDTASTSQESVF